MKSLIISPRFPWPAYTGDRVRAGMWLDALRELGPVALVAPEGGAPMPHGVEHFPARRSARALLRRALPLAANLPLQCTLTALFDWHTAIGRATRAFGGFDRTVVLLSRLHPWVRSHLTRPVALDAIDSLHRSAAERSRSSSAAARLFWQVEARRMRTLESNLRSEYDSILVVGAEESSIFGRADIVPNGVDVFPLDREKPRRFDVGFWGRLPYFANARAVDWILDEIWPAIHAQRPHVTAIIGGAEAPRDLHRRAERAGVRLVSPIDDVPAFAREIRVALLPLRFGTGQPTKVLEAAEAGCAIVTTPDALQNLEKLRPHVRSASTTDEFVRQILRMLDGGEHEQAVNARAVVESQFDRAVSRRRLAEIALRGAGR